MQKKSQIKMMETISVLLVFLILLTFLLIFYIGMGKSSAGKAADEKSNLRAVEIAQQASYMPEFQCSSKNIITENCFDILKLRVFMQFTHNSLEGNKMLNTTYYDIFKNSRISINELYPGDAEFIIYDRKPRKERYESRSSHIPISIYEPVLGEYYFAILEVEVYT
jgi:hypothetical protein